MQRCNIEARQKKSEDESESYAVIKKSTVFYYFITLPYFQHRHQKAYKKLLRLDKG